MALALLDQYPFLEQLFLLLLCLLQKLRQGMNHFE